MKLFQTILVLCTISSCAFLEMPAINYDNSEIELNSGYVPIDPLPAEIRSKNTPKNSEILKALPDETMRLAVGRLNAEGGVNFGGGNIGVKGENYTLVLDYIKFNTNSIEVALGDKAGQYVLDVANPDLIVPVYLGIGLRLTANIKVLKGEVNLGNLFALGAEAKAGKITGSLVLQTLGISGENVSSVIPFPSEINENSIQNALVALGTIKSKIYDPETDIKPRVLGVNNTLGANGSMSGFVSALLRHTQLLYVDN